MSVKAVLWDADGVLQQVPGSWARLLADIIGETRTRELLTDVWPVAQEAMRGRVELHVQLEELLAQHGVGDVAPRVREVWGTFDRYDDARALVTEVRELGLSCHLATNQDQLRASYMRERLGYDELFDSCFYSCEMGTAKPEADFFAHIATSLGLTPGELVFVDDTEVNVVAAGEAGIAAIHWRYLDGLDVLRSRLRNLGIAVG